MAFRRTLKRPVALAMLERGRARRGEEVQVYDAGRCIPARVVEACAYDPAGERLNV